MAAYTLADRPKLLTRLRSALLQRVMSTLVPKRVLVSRGPTTERRVALTFDDGPDTMTLTYLELLKKLDVVVTFFVIGDHVRALPQMVRACHDGGHEVAGHGMTHTAFPKLSRAALLEELNGTQALLPPSRTKVPLVRPPKGAKNFRSVAEVAAAGYTTVMWSLDSDDCRTDNAEEVAARVVNETRNGDIVLLHEEQQWTLDALPKIVNGLRARGFSFVTVGELISS